MEIVHSSINSTKKLKIWDEDGHSEFNYSVLCRNEEDARKNLMKLEPKASLGLLATRLSHFNSFLIQLRTISFNQNDKTHEEISQG